MPKKLKTETWLKKLPEPYRGLALKNYKDYPYPGCNYTESLDDAIHAFHWKSSPEGWKFWRSVFEWALWKPASPRPKLPKLPKKKK